MKHMFRTSMFGFNKEDVANFIAGQSKQYEKKIADLEKEKSVLAKEYEETVSQLNLRIGELEDYRFKKESDFASYGVARILCNKIDTRCVALLEMFHTAQSGVTALEECAEQMRKKLAAAEGLREKAKRFDQLSSVLGGIVSGKDPAQSLDAATQEPEVSFEAPDFKKVDLDAYRTELESIISDYRELVRLISEIIEK